MVSDIDLFKLVGSVFVNTDEANNSLQKTDEKAKKTGTTFGEVAGKAAKVGTAIVGASAAAVGGVVKLATSSAATADTIDKGSKRMKVSTDYYQQLGYAAGHSGVEMGTLEKAAKKLEGTDINLEDAMNQIMSLGTASERSQKAAELFGDAVAYQMTPMLEMTGQEFSDLTQRANELGIVMSEDAVNACVTLRDTMSDVQQSFGAVATNLGASLMPVVQQFADVLLEFMPFIQEAFTNVSPLLQDLFDKLMPPLMELLDSIFPVLMDILNTLMPIIIDLAGELLPAIVEIIQAILPIIPPILDIVKEIAPYLIEFVQMILPIIVKLFQKIMPFLVKICEAILPIIAEILPIIMEILEAIMPILDLLLDVLGFFLDIFGDLIKNVLPPIIKLLKDILTPILKVIITVIQAVGNAFRSVFEGIKNLWQNAPAFFQNIWNGIRNAFAAVGQFFSNVFTGAWNGIKNAFSAVGSFFTGIWDKIKGAFSAVGSWFRDIFTKAVEAIKRPFQAIGEFFRNIFSAIGNIVKAPINFVIRGLNALIGGLNRISFSLPDWIPVIGGRSFGFNIGYIPEMANGGEVEGTAIVGDDGPELIQTTGARVTPLNDNNNAFVELNDKLDTMIELMKDLMKRQIYLDGKALVGGLVEQMDRALGRLAAANGRYA